MNPNGTSSFKQFVFHNAAVRLIILMVVLIQFPGCCVSAIVTLHGALLLHTKTVFPQYKLMVGYIFCPYLEDHDWSSDKQDILPTPDKAT